MKRGAAAARLTAATIAALLLPGCSEHAHVLSPAGEGARAIAELTWVFLALSALVFVVVLVLLAVAARRPADREPRPDTDGRAVRWVVIGGGVIPAVILTVLFVPTLLTLGELSAVPAEDGLVIEVVGKQWWWEVVYRDGSNPQSAVHSANEVHIPSGARVPVRLTAADVIHSFWVPGLQGKLDLVPGRVNRTWLHADRPGVYRGVCAEYCGLQHTRMEILVVAHSPADFRQWLASEAAAGARRPAPGATPDTGAALPAAVAGRAVFERAACALCHQVRGTRARGRLGPDLTHFGSRRTIAAGTLANTRGNLAGWLTQPQALKPGSKMPRVPLTTGELHSLVAYLESLR